MVFNLKRTCFATHNNSDCLSDARCCNELPVPLEERQVELEVVWGYGVSNRLNSSSFILSFAIFNLSSKILSIAGGPPHIINCLNLTSSLLRCLISIPLSILPIFALARSCGFGSANLNPLYTAQPQVVKSISHRQQLHQQ